MDRLNNEGHDNTDVEQAIDALLLSHILNELMSGDGSDSETSSKSVTTYDSPMVSTVPDVQKRSESNAKRTRDTSRLAMRILKRNGPETSRVAYRILKKRGSNAARIAMRVLRKRDQDEDKTHKNFNRVTRAALYSNIGGYFGGVPFRPMAYSQHRQPHHYSQFFDDAPIINARKRANCISGCTEEKAVEKEQ